MRLIGSAHTKAKELNVTDKGVAIQITSCEVTTPYNAETKQGYTNYAIFAFNIPDSNGTTSNASAGSKKATKSTSKSKAKAKAAPETDVEESDDDLPF